MNERIKEFATLAKEHADTYDDAGTPIWFYMYNQKFSELIVRECMSLAQSHRSQIEDFAAGIDSVRENIKEHFNISE